MRNSVSESTSTRTIFDVSNNMINTYCRSQRSSGSTLACRAWGSRNGSHPCYRQFMCLSRKLLW